MTMIINAGGKDNGNLYSNPTIQLPPWDSSPEDPLLKMHSLSSISPTSNTIDEFSPLHRYLPSNNTSDAFSSDHFRMFEFKVKKCARGRSHDWTECPYAHPCEKARRRDPLKFNYSGTPCLEFRKGVCKKGDGCEFAHGVFECWLHPSRYRTQPCKDDTQCRRRICFFAHTPEQLRVLPPTRLSFDSVAESYDGSPSRRSFESGSPPMSPVDSLRHNSVNELSFSIRGLHIGSPSSQMGYGFFSPRSTLTSALRPGLTNRNLTGSGLEVFDIWDLGCREEPVMERVESGRDLRVRMYAKLSEENSLDRVDSATLYNDLGWVTELVK